VKKRSRFYTQLLYSVFPSLSIIYVNFLKLHYSSHNDIPTFSIPTAAIREAALIRFPPAL